MSYCCPDCDSIAYKRNGYTRHGKQNHRCLDCGRQFSVEADKEFNSFGINILENLHQTKKNDLEDA
jgi:transposase-like protein